MTEADLQNIANAKKLGEGVLKLMDQPTLKPSDIQVSLRNLAVAVVSICEVITDNC